jgi:hypothetical protein
MKNFILLLSLGFLFTSCAASFTGATTTGTSVNLEQNNFEVLSTVSGSATVTYVFGFGGNKKDAVIKEARAVMLRNANLIGGPKAIANEVIDIKTQMLFGIVTKYTVTLTANIIEFQ